MSYFNAFVAYKFLELLATPWEKTDAFKLGIIDKDGNVLIKRRDLTANAQKKAYTIFHQLVWKIKRILHKLPVLKTKLGSLAAALWFIKEYCEREGTSYAELEESLIGHLQEEYDIDIRECFMESYLSNDTLEIGEYEANLVSLKNTDEITEGKRFRLKQNIKPTYILGSAMYKLTPKNSTVDEACLAMNVQGIGFMIAEEAPVNNMGGGNIAYQEKPLSKKVHRRFKVDSNTFSKCKKGKKKYKRYGKYFDLNTDVGREIYDYARKNPKKPICIENEEDEEQVVYMRYNRRGGGGWRKRKPPVSPAEGIEDMG